MTLPTQHTAMKVATLITIFQRDIGAVYIAFVGGLWGLKEVKKNPELNGYQHIQYIYIYIYI